MSGKGWRKWLWFTAGVVSGMLAVFGIVVWDERLSEQGR